MFAPASLQALRAATAELSWLYERGYKPLSSLKLVGDRHALTERQRSAVARCACAESVVARRRQHRLAWPPPAGLTLWIDTFNLLTTLEVALSGGVVLIGRDGCARDIAGVHGSYRKVDETIPAIELVAQKTSEARAQHCHWLLDRPVSNSGRLAAILLDHARTRGLTWTAELVNNPDRLLEASEQPVVTADGPVLDRAATSLNLARHCIDAGETPAFVVDLSAEHES